LGEKFFQWKLLLMSSKRDGVCVRRKVEIIKSPFDKELYSICIRAEALKLIICSMRPFQNMKSSILDSDCKDAIKDWHHT
jgi:hypothetical protein